MKAYSEGSKTLVSPNEELKRGIWPRSFALWMAGFYVALFIIRPWEVLLPWLADIYFEKVYALCMIAVVFLSGKKQLRQDFQALTVILLFAAVVLSAIFSEISAKIPLISWEQVYEYLTIVIFFFILMAVIRTRYELVFVVTCYIVTMAVYLAKSQWEFFVYGQHRYDMGVYRLCGIELTFGGPNSLAMSIVVSLPMLVFLWSVRNEFSVGWPIFWKKWFPRFLVFYAWLALSSVILTNSRSGMVSFVLFVILVTFRGRGIGRKLIYILLGMILLVTLWFALPQEKKDRFRTIWDPESGPASAQVSAEGREEGFKAGMIMFERFPLTGVGIGKFIPYRVRYLDGIPLNAHNLAGQVLGETGIVGGGAFLLMIMVTLINCYKLRALAKKSRSDKSLEMFSNLGLACRDAIILLLFEGIFAHNALRYNWLWLAAFSTSALYFARHIVKQETQRNDYVKAVL